MSTGIVKFFSETKGYGFIAEDGTGRDIFVHATALIDKIRNGDKVEFDVQEGKKGLNAVRVKRIETA